MGVLSSLSNRGELFILLHHPHSCLKLPQVQGFLDCDGVSSNGCEVAASTDVHNCGEFRLFF